MRSGHICDGESLQDSKRVLTWHDEFPYRFWIGSLRTITGSQIIQSFEVQRLKRDAPNPSLKEQRLRLNLISNVVDQNNNTLTAGKFRSLPLGEILIERAELLMAALQRESWKLGSVTLIKDSQVRNSKNKVKREMIENSIIKGANVDDAILIAKIYVDQCKISTVRAAQRTADYLGVEVKLVHVALKIARRNMWLTSIGS